MRVISGIAKGRRLRATSAPEMRPTTDTARRTIFDILGDVPRDARVLDLFAGAGTLGIEALSRGARECQFVERDRAACSVILQNLEATGLRSNARIMRADVPRMLAKRPETAFDLVFLDPPYDAGLRFVSLVVEKLARGSWVAPGGTVVAEAPGGQIEWPAGLREIRTRRFGRTQVSVAVRDDGRGDSHLSGDV
jgi:16S rRNA (guanine966-N2)-methyltransferase